MRSDVISPHSDPLSPSAALTCGGGRQVKRRRKKERDANRVAKRQKETRTYKTVSVGRRGHIAPPLHYDTWPTDGLLARPAPVRCSGFRILPRLCTVQESAAAPVGIGGGVCLALTPPAWMQLGGERGGEGGDLCHCDRLATSTSCPDWQRVGGWEVRGGRA